ncbi:dienelactone hydrolase family protein [Ornithinicoccus halotolerans]|uniref:dienelactone hydrolase n=1 Tax=Ornithinicoccus halotolerans TaxID=1748220 RepID=UPI0012965BBA|nr:dienelactone hydrolase [Ornithinicoccus halotolerans]
MDLVTDGGSGAEPLLARLARDAEAGRASRTPEERRGWLAGLVEAAARCADHPPTARLLDHWQCAAPVPHTRALHEVTVLSGMPVSVRVLLPETAGPHPVVLAVPGHGPGAVAVCGPDPGAPDGDSTNGHGRFGLDLLAEGATVVVPEVLGLGPRQSAQDRAYDPDAPHACYRLATRLLDHGLTLAGVRVAELRGLLDVLPALLASEAGAGHAPLVGAAGFSGGAPLAAVLGAVDDRVSALALTGWPGSYEGSIHAVRHCLCNHLPGQAPLLEQADLLALLAPRPLGVATGRQDPIFSLEGFEQVVRALAGVYGQAGATDRLVHHVHPGGHEVDGSRLWPWLVRVLREPDQRQGQVGSPTIT